MKKLENKVAVITGGNSGIGLSTAQEFKAQGAKVVIVGRRQESLDEALQTLGEGSYAVLADVSKKADLEALPHKIEEQVGKIDILFVNAGIAFFAPVDQVDEAFFDQTFDVNVKGAYFSIQKLLPIFNDNGSIILNASIAANVGMAGASVYAASKAAVLSFARTLSAELVERGIRVNSISPGPISTPLYGKMGMPAEQVEGFANSIQEQVPMKRFGTPEEVAKVVLFLASQDSSYILGEEITIDGGMTTL